MVVGEIQRWRRGAVEVLGTWEASKVVLAGRVDVGGRLWLCRPVETGGIVVWQCHKQWVARLEAAVKSLAAGGVAAPALLLVKVVVVPAAGGSRLVVEAK